jgi:hypothetical protein
MAPARSGFARDPAPLAAVQGAYVVGVPCVGARDVANGMAWEWAGAAPTAAVSLNDHFVTNRKTHV